MQDKQMNIQYYRIIDRILYRTINYFVQKGRTKEGVF